MSLPACPSDNPYKFGGVPFIGSRDNVDTTNRYADAENVTNQDIL